MPDSVELVEVYRAAGEMEARVVIGLLEANGIPALIKSRAPPPSTLSLLTVSASSGFL